MRSCSKARRALRPILRLALGAAALGLAAAPASALPQCGGASWYQHQGRTASGEINNPDQLTAAHRKLPFGTQVRVSNLSNGKSVVVRINDRGPFISGRVIDVSRAAAAKLGIQRRGVGRVRITAADQKDRGCS